MVARCALLGVFLFLVSRCCAQVDSVRLLLECDSAVSGSSFEISLSAVNNSSAPFIVKYRPTFSGDNLLFQFRSQSGMERTMGGSGTGSVIFGPPDTIGAGDTCKAIDDQAGRRRRSDGIIVLRLDPEEERVSVCADWYFQRIAEQGAVNDSIRSNTVTIVRRIRR